MARMQYEQAKGAVEQATGAVEAASSVAKESRVVAPFAGRVAKKMVEPGDLAAPGRPLVMIESTAGRRLVLSVPESIVAASKLAVGRDAPRDARRDARRDAAPGPRRRDVPGRRPGQPLVHGEGRRRRGARPDRRLRARRPRDGPPDGRRRPRLGRPRAGRHEPRRREGRAGQGADPRRDARARATATSSRSSRASRGARTLLVGLSAAPADGAEVRGPASGEVKK